MSGGGTARPGRLLGVFAHPDDETFCAGGTLARCAAQGAEVMVVSATRGEAGQIRDARVGTRRQIAAVREAELRLAAERLGVARVLCLDHVDGTLADADFAALVAEVGAIIAEFQPRAVISFGPDGGYGHPDHVTISAATTEACRRRAEAWAAAGTGPRLYHSCFPPGNVLLMERLASWLTRRRGRFVASQAFAHALLVISQEAATMRFIRDHTEVRWYPPGSYVVEQGEAAAELFLILSGAAEVWEEAAGERRRLGRLGRGEFFGELGVAGNRPRSADVVASQGLTCLVLSTGPPRTYAGRGAGARLAGAAGERAEPAPAALPRAAFQCDVSAHLEAKVAALCAYRSQFSLEPGLFPPFLLQEIFGREHFVQVPPPGPPRVDLS